MSEITLNLSINEANWLRKALISCVGVQPPYGNTAALLQILSKLDEHQDLIVVSPE